jgi:thiamine pyrophosphate-dependent acetolactate synthase large subunit-like protein
MARGWGCRAVDIATAEELEQEFKTALSADTTTVIVVPTQPPDGDAVTILARERVLPASVIGAFPQAWRGP